MWRETPGPGGGGALGGCIPSLQAPAARGQEGVAGDGCWKGGACRCGVWGAVRDQAALTARWGWNCWPLQPSAVPHAARRRLAPGRGRSKDSPGPLALGSGRPTTQEPPRTSMELQHLQRPGLSLSQGWACSLRPQPPSLRALPPMVATRRQAGRPAATALRNSR